jgi:hypothetical protein
MLICKKNSKVDYLGLLYRVHNFRKTAVILKSKDDKTIIISPAQFCDELRIGNLQILEV